MNTTGTSTNVSSQHNPFERVKARHLIGWLVVSFPLLLVAMAFTDDSAIDTVWAYAWVYVVPLVWYALRARKKGLQLSGLAGEAPASARWLRYVLLNIPVLLLSLGSIIVIYGLISKLAPHTVETLLSEPQSEILAAAQHPFFATVLQLLGALVLAPIVEEFIFRGFLLHRWATKWGVRRAVIAVSILFGILHINFFGAAAFSIVLCMVYVHTRSIWPGIVMHFINNIISSWPRTPSDTPLSAGDLQGSYIVGWVLVIISLPILVWFVRKHWPAKDTVLPYKMV